MKVCRVREGRVLFFKFHENYGFIETQEGGIFFHGSRRQEPTFNGGDMPLLCGWLTPNPPRRGDVLYFEDEIADRGRRAKWWAYKSEYEAVLELIKARPYYRLMEHRGPIKYGRLEPAGYEKPRQLWCGKDITELRAKWPTTYYPILQRDWLRRWIEVKNCEQVWVPADDPRPYQERKVTA